MTVQDLEGHSGLTGTDWTEIKIHRRERGQDSKLHLGSRPFCAEPMQIFGLSSHGQR
jgi:hypothetical protein